MEKVIVSRHAAAIQFVAKSLGYISISTDSGAPHIVARETLNGKDIPILTQATPSDVAGKVVYGNLPLHLAALAAEVHVIEFEGSPPRGQEYTLADMEAAGAVLRRYVVMNEARMLRLGEFAHSDGYGPSPRTFADNIPSAE